MIVDYDKELIRRTEMYILGDTDQEYAKAQLRLCMNGIDGCIYFFDNFLWTYDPRTKYKELPFVLYDFQRQEIVPKINNSIEYEDDALLVKPRDMGVSYVCLGILLWRWRFYNEDFRIGSRKEEYVDHREVMDALFPKLRKMLYSLPKWMMPVGWNSRLCDSHMRLINPEGGIIVGEATNPNFGRGGRSKATLFDEFAAWECDSVAWEGAADTTPCRLGISTLGEDVNCKFNTLRREWLETSPQRVIELNWRMHPKKSEKWYDNEKTRRSDRDLAREVDCIESEAGGAVFREFRYEHHVKDLTRYYRQFIRDGGQPYEAIDPHDSRPCVFTITIAMPNGHIYVVCCAYLDGDSPEEVYEQIQTTRVKFGYRTPINLKLDAKFGVKKSKFARGVNWHNFFIDNEEPVELSMSNPGSIEYGHKIIKSYLRYNDGPAMITFCSSGASQAITAMERYSYDENGKVRENYKDPIDTIRYILADTPEGIEPVWKQTKTFEDIVKESFPRIQKPKMISSVNSFQLLEGGGYTTTVLH